VTKTIVLKIKSIFVPCSENNYRPKFLESKFLFYYLLFLLILKLITVSSLIYFPKTIFFADLSNTILIQLTNQGREFLSLNPLKENPQLSQAAYLKAQDMVAKDYFAHQSPEGKTPWYWIKAANYDYQYAGENLAIGFLDPEEVYQTWEDSPSHRANLFNQDYQDIGIAVLKGDFRGNETFVVVQLFGSPKITPKEQPSPEGTPPVPSGAGEVEEKITEEKPEISPQEISQEMPQEKVGQDEVVFGESEEKAGPLEEPLSPVYLSSFENREIRNSFGFNFFQFLSLNYNNLIQKIIFYSLVFIIISLIINIFVRVDVQYEDLIVKAAFSIVLLMLFNFLDKELIIQLIPHNFLIY